MDKFYQEIGVLKNIYITENLIMASTEDYNEKEVFLSKLNEDEHSDKHVKIEYNQITKIVLFEDQNTVQIFYKENEDEFKTNLHIYQQTDFEAAFQFILSKCKHGEGQKGEIHSFLPALKPALYTVMVAMFSIALVLVAKDIEAEKTMKIGGANRGAKGLLMNIAEILGMWGSISVGLIVTTVFVFYTYKTYSKAKKKMEIYTIEN